MLKLHEKRRCKCAEHIGDESWHGRASGYNRHFCRCDGCTFYGSSQAKRWRTNHPDAARRAVNAYRSRNSDAIQAAKRAWMARNPLAVQKGAARTSARNAQIDSQATRGGLAWTRAEELIVMRTDLRAMDAAILIGRTVDAVAHRRRKLGGVIQ